MLKPDHVFLLWICAHAALLFLHEVQCGEGGVQQQMSSSTSLDPTVLFDFTSPNITENDIGEQPIEIYNGGRIQHPLMFLSVSSLAPLIEM
jgi:hypothetical protein